MAKRPIIDISPLINQCCTLKSSNFFFICKTFFRNAFLFSCMKVAPFKYLVIGLKTCRFGVQKKRNSSLRWNGSSLSIRLVFCSLQFKKLWDIYLSHVGYFSKLYCFRIKASFIHKGSCLLFASSN